MIRLQIYSLIGCYFSQKAELSMMDFKLGDKLEIIKVEDEEKEKYKKLNKMNTFPQIFLLNNKKKN
jgi:glutaredoxin